MCEMRYADAAMPAVRYAAILDINTFDRCEGQQNGHAAAASMMICRCWPGRPRLLMMIIALMASFSEYRAAASFTTLAEDDAFSGFKR